MKRPRRRRSESDEDNSDQADTGTMLDAAADGTIDTLGRQLLSPFGREEIHELTSQGNATFARGGFGELSVALRLHRATDGKDDRGGDVGSDGTVSYSFVAVKTIENAVVSSGGGGGGGFSSYGLAQQQQRRCAQSSHQLSRDVFNEIVALRYLNPHPNIVPLVAMYSSSSSSPRSLSLAFEYAPIDLHLALEWRRRMFLPPLAFAIIKTIAIDFLSALVQCHDHGVLHRDFKPGNLLVSSSGRIQLCDFGLAKPFVAVATSSNGPIGDGEIKPQAGESATKGICTLHYRPPEILLGGLASHPSVDMYSAGMVLAELIGGRTLLAGQNVLDQLSMVYGILGTPTETTWATVRELPDYGKLSFGIQSSKPWTEILPRAAELPHLMDLLSKLVVLDPNQRLSANQAVSHICLQQQQQKEAFLAPENPIADASTATHRQVRDELIQPCKLRAQPFLFPSDRSVASRLALDMAKERRSFLAVDSCHWQGPHATSLVTHKELCTKFQTKHSQASTMKNQV